MRTNRWYIFENVVRGDLSTPYEITSWSKTQDAARVKVDKADPKCELKAFKVFAPTRQQAMRDAAEVFGVKVEGYVSPEDKQAGRAIVKAAVMRAIFCPYTGVVLDMRRAVVVVTSTRSFVLAATHWDEIKDEFAQHVGPEVMARVTVYDGRELFKR